ncbi:PBAN-type neuropeptides-like [Diabrotica virgifera virgifera]|uniref:PBAN-type neuropeptides-like n=1 Tax=Diabrotica virgifera virgifera TaxID=50390 RepID=A0A6P7FCU7_DIAVI|nr:PBAN-type neuropeptides-like [Diabrotica virgifera virgifera]
MNISVGVSVLFLLTLYFKNITSHELEKSKEDESKYSAPVWFGPRVGRKKRGFLDEEYKNIDKQELETLLELIKKNPWTIMLFSNGKGRLLNFNPKESSIEGLNEDEITEIVQRSMFAPRLGRSAFFPRLGRDNEME